MNITASKTIDTIPDNAAKAKKWVAQLPTSNFGEMTRRIFFCMGELNRSQLSHTCRIEVAEVIRPYAEMALKNLNKHLIARSFPLLERSKKIFDLNQSLLLEMAGAYQLAALDMLTKGNSHPKLLLLSVGRALNYMGRVLINTYSVYIKPKASLWRDIHHLYLLACENKIEKLPIPDKTPAEYVCKSIEDYYKHISLLALARPNTIRLGEIGRLDKFFRIVLDNIVIHSDPDMVSGKYAHIAMLNSDEPASLMPVAELLHSPTTRIFNLNKVIVTLEEFSKDTEKNSLGSNSTYPMLTHSLATRLLSVITVVKNRRFKRFSRDEKTPVVSHLSNIVKVLYIEQKHTNDNTAYNEDELFEELIYGEKSSTSSPWSAIDASTELAESNIEMRVWDIINSSSEGYGLMWKERDSAGVRVGELVAIQDPADDTDRWQIGTIRWMEYVVNQGLCAGVEMLSPRALPLAVKNVTNRKLTQKLPVDGLILPRIEGLKDKNHLILPDYMFTVGDQLEIKIGNRMENIEIISKDEGLGAFAYCQYLSAAPQISESIEEDSFNEIWDAL